MANIARGYLRMGNDNNVYWPCVIDDSGDRDGRPVVYLTDNPDCVYVLDLHEKGKGWSLKKIHPCVCAGAVIQVCVCNKHYAGTLMIVEYVCDDYIMAKVHGFNGRDYYQKIAHGEYYYIGKIAVDF